MFNLSTFDPLVGLKVTLIVVALVALWPGWLTLQRIIYGRRPVVRMLVFIVYTALFVVVGVVVPFVVSWGKTVGPRDLLIDFVLFGVSPLVALALGAYVLDHMADWSPAVALMAAGCVSVAVLPIGYVVFEESLTEIMLKKPETENADTNPRSDSAGVDSAGVDSAGVDSAGVDSAGVDAAKVAPTTADETVVESTGQP